MSSEQQTHLNTMDREKAGLKEAAINVCSDCIGHHLSFHGAKPRIHNV